ncbi:PREDICTED: ubiquitin carboxyl-terminal hydrolase 20 isoform X1 [Camelina sativa]|uniref:Ubiquitin carboxyl-terminal hydrolase n=1 Tax=Camelina sativa TaxID=90675 RepID=A0ABM0U1V1_CAMSA|nr:PREDICTED: ubiquitin carboxyl-terminal hydrolase 20 isoform X1 [Camelina sativa]
MLVANSDVSSSILSRTPLIPNSIETLDEIEDSPSPSPSPQIPSTDADVVNVQSLALTSPDRDRDSPPNFDEYTSSSSSDETQFVPSPINFDYDEIGNGTQRLLESQVRIGGNSQTLDDLDDVMWDGSSSDDHRENNSQPWTPNVSPGFGSDDDDNNSNSKKECSEPLLSGFMQRPLKIDEPVTGVGAGLWNLGNTCFFNSVLQCFTHTVPLIEGLRSYKYQDPCNCGNEFFCVIRALRTHIDFALRPERIPMAPDYFLHHLNYFSPDFQRYQQEDAHEFLQAFLDKLERCCLDRTSYRSYVSSQDANFVDQVFGGRLISGLRCCNCNSISDTFEKSVGLSLEIEDMDTLESALESFTRVEKLDEQLTCDNCNEKVSKEKQLLLDKLPLVVTFHLKRFKNNGFYMEKIFKHVKIPLELDLQPYMRDKEENDVPTKYHLYALVEHLGYSVTYGHYLSYVRSAPKIWHQFDDVKVTRIDEDSVLSQDSYILFYAREGTPWFSSIAEQMQPLLPLLEASLANSSPKSVLDSSNGECLSEISYENVDKSSKPCDSAGVSNQHGKTEEDFVSLSNELNEDVFLSAESSSDEDSSMPELMDPLDTDDPYVPGSEKEPNTCLAIERATTGDDFFPLLMVEDQDSFQKHQDSAEGTFRMQLKQMEETAQNQEKPWKQPLLISDVAVSKEAESVNGDLMKKPSPRARDLLDQSVSTTTGSPPKKLKTT